MENHTKLDDWCEEMGCPVHENPIRKTYTFGQYGDAEVVTFKGCGCAVCINAASLLFGRIGGEHTYHNTYSNAAGRATLIKMQEGVKNAPFSGGF